jgi:fatty acid desaturase
MRGRIRKTPDSRLRRIRQYPGRLHATKESRMSVERVIFAFAGIMILVSLALAYFVSPYWLALAAIVGLNLSQSAFTGFCPFAYILKKLGLKSGTAFS